MLGAVVSGLKGLLDGISRGRDRQNDRQDQALAAIYAAANETRMYIRNATQSSRRNLEREAELVRLWTKAAVPVRHIDRDLADRCLLKAEFWINPNEWTVAQVRQFRIGLDEVYNYARQLLQE